MMEMDKARERLDVVAAQAPYCAPAIETVLVRLAELEAAEVTVEYGVRWPEAAALDLEVEETRDRAHAEKVAWQEQGEVVQREIRTGPWKPAVQS